MVQRDGYLKDHYKKGEVQKEINKNMDVKEASEAR